MNLRTLNVIFSVANYREKQDTVGDGRLRPGAAIWAILTYSLPYPHVKIWQHSQNWKYVCIAITYANRQKNRQTDTHVDRNTSLPHRYVHNTTFLFSFTYLSSLFDWQTNLLFGLTPHHEGKFWECWLMGVTGSALVQTK